MTHSVGPGGLEGNLWEVQPQGWGYAVQLPPPTHRLAGWGW